MKRVPVIETELGPERLCRGCGEWWPLDAEFWYFYLNAQGKQQVMGRCRACWSERPIVDGRRLPFRPPILTTARTNPDNGAVEAPITEVQT